MLVSPAEKPFFRDMLLRASALQAVFALSGMMQSTEALAAPQGGVVNAGSAQISGNAANTVITQQSGRAVIDWQSFDVAAGERVTFNQASSSDIALNRIHDIKASQIDGALNANGQVWLVNPNGVTIGKGARVNVNSLVVSSSDISNTNFMAGQNTFNIPGNPGAAIVNEGTITAQQAGLVALVAPNVSNSGTINAKLGKVQLASGDVYGLDLYGDGLVSVEMSKDAVQSVINSGAINAQGGTVTLTAAAAENIINSVVSNSGKVNADSVGNHTGSVTISAEGSNAVAGNVVANKGIKQGASTVLVSGTISAVGKKAGQTGGSITVTGDHIAILKGATIDASGKAGGGTVRIGGDFHGAGATPTALRTIVQQGATIKANATDKGNGGNVTVWADDRTDFGGLIEAKGGPNGGNGGMVETSGKKSLNAVGVVDASAPKGKAGTWLLDPNNITIEDDPGTGDVNIAGDPNFTTTDDSSILTRQSIENELNNGTSVSVTTGAAGSSSEAGNIYVNNSIHKTAGTGAELDLTATNDIVFAKGVEITSTSDMLHMEFTAGRNVDLSAENIILVSNGCDVNMTAGTINPTGTIILGSTTITTSGGWITMFSPVTLTGDQHWDAGTGIITLYSTVDGAHDFTPHDFTLNADTIFFNKALGGTTPLGNVSLTSAESIALPSITATSVFTQTTNSDADIFLFPGTTISTTGNITLVAGGDFINASGPDALQSSGGNWLVYSSNPAGVDSFGDPIGSDNGGLVEDFKRYNCVYGGSCGGAPGFGNGFLYSVAPVITVTADDQTRIYGDANPTFTYSMSGFIDGDSQSDGIATSGAPALSTAAVFNSNVGNYAINAATGSLTSDLGYSFVYAGGTLNITPKTISVASGITAQNKVYDSTTAATLNYSAPSFSGVVAGDTLTLDTTGVISNFSDKNAANHKFVVITGLALDGAAASNYTLTQPTGVFANITPFAIVTTGVTVNSRAYDGTTAAPLNTSSAGLSGVFAGDAVNLVTGAASGTYANANVGVSKAVTISGFALSNTDAGNYTLAQPTGIVGTITPKALTLTSGATANNKVYNATTAATLTIGTPVFSGLVGSETVALDSSEVVANFNNKNVGNAKPVTVTGLALSGAAASNYTLTQPAGLTANITPLAITISNVTASNKIYDGTTADALNKGTAALVGVISGDHVTLNTGAGTGAFGDANVGTGKAVTASRFTISNTDAGNYTLIQPTGLAANISAKLLSILSGVTANNKVYDSTTAATLTVGTPVFSGLVGAETVGLSSGTALSNFSDKNVASGKAVTVTGLTLTGAAASNYTLAQPAGLTANITSFAITVTGAMATNKVYDATVTDALNTGSAALSGVFAGDVVTLNTGSATGNFADKNVGNAKAVTASGFTISNTDASNYTLTQPAGLTANITPQAITITGVSAQNKVYDATTVATLNTGAAALSGVIVGDHVTLNSGASTGAFADPNVGTGKAVTASGFTISNTDGGNYTLAQPTGLFANITAKALSLLSGVTANNKVYDATTAATLTYGTPVFSGLAGSDVLTLNTGSVVANFSDKNVAGDKAVTVTGLALSGAAASNYSFSQPTGLTANITPLAITATGVTANDKIYDATTVATLNTGGAALSGVISGDIVGLNTGAATGAFADPNAGLNKPVTVSALSLTGGDAGNYTLSQPTGVTATINKATLTVTAPAQDRAYGAANPDPALTYTGFVGGETPAVIDTPATGSYPTALPASNAGTTHALTILGGTADNYTIVLAPGTGALTITKADLLAAVDDKSKTFGDPDPAFTLSFSGFANGENASVFTANPTVLCPTCTDTATTVGNHTLSASGGAAANYNFIYTNGILAVNTLVVPAIVPAAIIDQQQVVQQQGAIDRPLISLRDSAQADNFGFFRPGFVSIDSALQKGETTLAANNFPTLSPAAGSKNPSALNNLSPSAGGNTVANFAGGGELTCANETLDKVDGVFQQKEHCKVLHLQ